MFLGNFYKPLTAAAVFAGVVVAGMLIVSKSGQAANDNNWPQAISQIQEAIFASGAPNSVFFTRT